MKEEKITPYPFPPEALPGQGLLPFGDRDPGGRDLGDDPQGREEGKVVICDVALPSRRWKDHHFQPCPPEVGREDPFPPENEGLFRPVKEIKSPFPLPEELGEAPPVHISQFLDEGIAFQDLNDPATAPQAEGCPQGPFNGSYGGQGEEQIPQCPLVDDKDLSRP